MAHPRTPLTIARATGRTAHDPQRYRNSTDPAVSPLGSATPDLSEHEQHCFEYFRTHFHWLAETDRTLVEMASKLRVLLLTDKINASQANLLKQCLGLMGGTPGDRSKMPIEKAEELNEFGFPQ